MLETKDVLNAIKTSAAPASMVAQKQHHNRLLNVDIARTQQKFVTWMCCCCSVQGRWLSSGEEWSRRYADEEEQIGSDSGKIGRQLSFLLMGLADMLTRVVGVHLSRRS